jgi:hypothetical protein
MSLWNFTVMMCVLFFAPISFNLKYFMADAAGSGVTASNEEVSESIKKLVVGTGAPGPLAPER